MVYTYTKLPKLSLLGTYLYRPATAQFLLYQLDIPSIGIPELRVSFTNNLPLSPLGIPTT